MSVLVIGGLISQRTNTLHDTRDLILRSIDELNVKKVVITGNLEDEVLFRSLELRNLEVLMSNKDGNKCGIFFKVTMANDLVIGVSPPDQLRPSFDLTHYEVIKRLGRMNIWVAGGIHGHSVLQAKTGKTVVLTPGMPFKHPHSALSEWITEAANDSTKRLERMTNGDSPTWTILTPSNPDNKLQCGLYVYTVVGPEKELTYSYAQLDLSIL